MLLKAEVEDLGGDHDDGAEEDDREGDDQKDDQGRLRTDRYYFLGEKIIRNGNKALQIAIRSL